MEKKIHFMEAIHSEPKITDSTILDCGHKPSEHSSFTTGYGRDSEGKTACYECAAKLDMEYMRATGKACLYLVKNSSGQYEITNWPGSLRLHVYRAREGRHNIGRTRTDVWFTGPDGFEWHGVQIGENNQVVRCIRKKPRPHR